MSEATATLRVCTECPVPHVENCPECFGFGRDPVTGALITASKAEELRMREHEPVPRCPTCGGNPFGTNREP